MLFRWLTCSLFSIVLVQDYEQNSFLFLSEKISTSTRNKMVQIIAGFEVYPLSQKKIKLYISCCKGCVKRNLIVNTRRRLDTVKNKKIGTPKKVCCNHPKIWTMRLYHTVMLLKDTDGIANSVDPDQTAPLGAVWSGSALFAQACLSENLESLR